MKSLVRRAVLAYMEHTVRDTMKGVYATPHRVLRHDPTLKLLDLGCHQGEFAMSIGRSAGTSRVFGIEFNRGLAALATDRGVTVAIANLNQGVPLANDSIDIVTAFNVLEHLVQTRLVLEEIYRVLRPGGTTIIDTPNLASWHNIAALLAGIQPFSGPNITSMTDSDVPIVQQLNRRAHNLPEETTELETFQTERYRHIVVVAFRSLVKTMRQIGFVIYEARGYGYYPFPPLLSRYLSRLDPWHAHHTVIVAKRLR